MRILGNLTEVPGYRIALERRNVIASVVIPISLHGRVLAEVACIMP